ncbi:flagellar biosynthetic protein FliO [Lederbergia wuyishanensis]|uniref:Flagellar protein FliO/FliZ n=1 Tax=Lederbergia wuyishanensis TaxID=1347903 RepID=A0ABU0CZR2_9BACI|nr:flagellar biosynthetic protein FliO [Lederbergia wuyishanensis]MCJ8006276.1 flagellar biosynthetic protein FliO [Lederbergia wuyishanensis]MDQ0341645.1 flagellar protein FliO/FliZ [Lederbergia wuyishanensis]
MNSIIKQVAIVFTIMCILLSQADQIIVFAENNPLGGTVKECYTNNCNEVKDKVQDKGTKLDQPDNKNSFGVGVAEFLKMILALIFVIAILYFLLKFINKKSQSYQQNRLVQNLGGTPLGGNRSIQIVKVGNRLLVLGVGENVQLLKEIADEEEYENYLKQYEDQLDQSLQPVNMITNWIKRLNKSTNETRENEQQPFHIHLKRQLDEIKKERKQSMKKLDHKESNLDE